MTVKIIPLEKVSLVIYKIVRLFVDALTVDDKHYLLNRFKLTQPIQMKLSQKQKTFTHFFFFFIFKACIKFPLFFQKI